MNHTDNAALAALAAQGFNRVPVHREVLADFETPLSTYRKLAAGPYSYLFESVEGGEKWSRFSIIGLPCKNSYRVFGNRIEVWDGNDLKQEIMSEDPLSFIESLQADMRSPEDPELPMFFGGLVGFFGYDTVRYVEPRLRASCPKDELKTPDILLMVSDEVLVFDNLAGTLKIVVNADPGNETAVRSAQARVEELIALLSSTSADPLPPVSLQGADGGELEAQAKSSMSQGEYEDAVRRVKEYVLDGDVMQVVPAQRMSVPFTAPPLNLYRALRNLNPSPYLFYLDLDKFHVVGSSPEILVRAELGKVTVRPIAGTRRRGQTEDEDRELEADLLADPKEIAEHLMLIDLGRNDVGRIAETGSVKLTEKMLIERYSHVMHIVSNVEGDLLPDCTAIDALRAALPAGTLSGAPKIRAMEIIDELEPVKRGIYGGAVGYLSYSGNMDTAIAIRTAVVKDETLHIQVGAGVVADSVPSSEWQETLDKARALLRAAAMVAAGGVTVPVPANSAASATVNVADAGEDL
ncbi:MAG: anthranilate synthase component I [Pseudomonadota bacterium]